MKREEITAFVGDMMQRMAATDITALTIETDGCKLILERGGAAVRTAAPVQMNTTTVEVTPALPAVPEDTDAYVVKSPIVGTFYAAPEPEAPAFVKVGSRVAKGDVLGIMEAMKMMNEIEAEQAGIVTEILVKNGQLVEYGQPLFIIKPEGSHA